MLRLSFATDSVRGDLARFEPPFPSIGVMDFRCERPGGSADCLSKASGMLRKCITEHSACPRDNKDVELPKRVINVGDPATGQALRLFETNGERGKYICLSHCWGQGVKPLATLTTNLEQMRKHIPVEKLPKSFSDCLEVARSLGVQYVWIDSLCIIQDSKEDWQTESSKMANIYGECHLCVTASAAANAADGLIYADHHAGTGPYLLDPAFTEKVAPGLKLYVREIPSDSSYSGFYSNIRGFGYDLPGRAWCQEEFFLPPRVLQFGKGELQWDCPAESFRCHDSDSVWTFVPGTEGKFVPATTSGRHIKKLIHETLVRKTGNLEEQKQRLWDQWRLEVKVYSSKWLTVESDRLPAFSGMAQRFSELGADTPYLAGIWLADAWRQLCWTVIGGPLRRPDKYRAPSFSWASIEGRVEFANHMAFNEHVICTRTLTARTAQIIGGECKSESGDAFGAVTSGYLGVLGRILKGGFYEAPVRPTMQHVVRVGDQRYPFQLDVSDQSLDDTALFCLSMAKSAIWENGPIHPEGGPGYPGRYSEGYAFVLLKRSRHDLAAYERVGWGWPDTHEHVFQRPCKACTLFEEADYKLLKLV